MRTKPPVGLNEREVAQRLDMALAIAEEVEGVITPIFKALIS
mgnify:CR=1 FL=1